MVHGASKGAFGEILRRHRLSAGLTQEELAEASGLSVRAVADMERGRTARPYRRSVALLAEALGLSGADRDTFARAARNCAPDVLAPVCGPASLRTDRPLVPRHLPPMLAWFTGRTAELKRLDDLIGGGRGDNRPSVCVITGMAGVGKTALAVHWGHRVADRFPDGQLSVNLRGFDPSGAPLRPEAALHGLLEALQVPSGQIPAGLDAQVGLYRSLLADRAVLVVLDNARDPEQVRSLLPGGGRCLAIVTSRNQLTGLIAADGAWPLWLDALTRAEAIDLLASRMGAERVEAEPVAAQRIADLCAGLPVALSVAAARVSVRPGVTLGALEEELRDPHRRLEAFATGDAATDTRTVFSWSYQLLSPPAARMFRLLGLHPGPEASLNAAASLGGLPIDRARSLLAELIGAHLLTEVAPGRFTFHDLLRAYAGECARAHESAEVRGEAIRRVLTWYLRTAAEAIKVVNPARPMRPIEPLPPWSEPLSFASYERALGWLDAERGNLVAAVSAAARNGDHHIAWQLPLCLHDWFGLRAYGSHVTDWIACDETGLASARRLGNHVAQGWILNHLGIAHMVARDQPRAMELWHQSIAEMRMAGSNRGETTVLINLGWGHSRAGESGQALDCLRQALAAVPDMDRPLEQATIHAILSGLYRREGRFEDAMTAAGQAVEIFRAIDNPAEESGSLTALSLAYLGLGRTDAAIGHASRALDLARRADDPLAEAFASSALARALRAGGQRDQARTHDRHARRIYARIGAPLADPALGQVS